MAKNTFPSLRPKPVPNDPLAFLKMLFAMFGIKF